MKHQIKSVPALVIGQSSASSDFSDLSLEELIQVEVSSLGPKSSTVFDTPAPAYIVSNDEIHRRGANTLPEVLRLVPGVQISRINSSNCAITNRGAGSEGLNSLLVGTRIDWDRPGGGNLTVIAEHRELRVKGTIDDPPLVVAFQTVAKPWIFFRARFSTSS